MSEQSASAESVFSGTKPVEERHRFDEARLALWMQENVSGYKGPLTVSQFKGGQSNPSYRLDTPGHSYVLRRKPMGKLLPSAHAVDREFRVISALYPTGYPVAKPWALCTDDGVIGSMFYIMDAVEGRIFWNAQLPGLSNAQRGEIFTAEVETLARLHQLDYNEIGLADFGKTGNYFARQIDRWTKQYRASETEKNETVERLIAFLPNSVPEQERTSVVHGDYRLDNMIFARDAQRVVAVLDWELATLGDPLADFTYFLCSWLLPPDGRSGLGGVDIAALGIPSLEEVVAIYCKATNRPGLPNLDWYFAYNLFRIVGILQGIAGRVRDGTAASAQAQQTIKRIRPLAEASWSFAKKAGA
ncbi:MAG: phosphotransferase family protein [Beijerinckiaceae bacterium]